MKTMIALCMITPVMMYADTLQELIESATHSNDMVISKKMVQESKLKEVESAQNSYYPTLDIGGAYQNLEEKTPNIAGDIYTGYAKVGLDLYDGGIKSSTIDVNKALLDASKFDTSAYKKSLELAITQDFYNIKSEEGTLQSLEEKNNQLEAELERIKEFYKVGSATTDQIDRLQAALSNNLYQIDTTKYQILSLKKLLSIKVGKSVETLDDSIIIAPQSVAKESSDAIKALKANASSYEYAARGASAVYYPQLRIEDTYSFYDYGRTDIAHPEGLDKQNKLMLTLNMRLFDGFSANKQKEAKLLYKSALEAQIKQASQTQEANIELAHSKIETTKAQIQSAKSSLESATSAYETIAQKYKVGVVDNVTYLDALTTKTNAKVQYGIALNNLQIAYATYYYYTNNTIKEYIK